MNWEPINQGSNKEEYLQKCYQLLYWIYSEFLWGNLLH